MQNLGSSYCSNDEPVVVESFKSASDVYPGSKVNSEEKKVEAVEPSTESLKKSVPVVVDTVLKSTEEV